jgi:hypothetical protein
MAMCLDQVRFNKSHAICLTSIVCKFVVEGKVFVKKEKINDEFLKEKTVTLQRLRMILFLRQRKVTV